MIVIRVYLFLFVRIWFFGYGVEGYFVIGKIWISCGGGGKIKFF